MTTVDDDAMTRWLGQFTRSAESAETLDHLVGVVNDRIVEALPEFEDPTLLHDLHASTRSHWKGFLDVVGRESIQVSPAPQVFDLARTLARRGYELPLLLSVYRIGQRAVWQFITTKLEREVPDPALRAAVLLRFWSNVAIWLDTTLEALIVAFTEEREQWQRGALARRAGVVQAILAGQAVDIDRATTALAYPLSRHHVAFTLRAGDEVPDLDVQRLLENGSGAISSALGGSRPLMVASGARAVWCWTSTPGPVDSSSALAEAVLPGLLFGTLGRSHLGVAGFRASHQEAVAALSIGRRPQGGLLRFEEVELACLAAGALGPDLRRAFADRELGTLAGHDESTVRLRQSLRVYLQQGCDATATGELLGLHPNTVRYRIRQAENKIGHSILYRRGHVELALEIIDVLPDC